MRYPICGVHLVQEGIIYPSKDDFGMIEWMEVLMFNFVA